MQSLACFAVLVLLCPMAGLTQSNTGSARSTPQRIETVDFDWDHSGQATRFSLSYRGSDSFGDANRLTIRKAGSRPWVLLNQDDAWAPLDKELPPDLLKVSQVHSKRMLFVSSGDGARSYLILKGGDDGWRVGSLWVLTPGEDGVPKIVFHAKEHLLYAVEALPDGKGIVVIGQPSDDEARTEYAASYDPFRAYVITGSDQGQYDLERSKAYTIKNYCEWAGPQYDERFVAVTIHPGKYGEGNCRVMKESQFQAYCGRHLGLCRE